MQKITPFLWFDTQAEEAARFYVSVFANSRILKTVRYRTGKPLDDADVKSAIDAGEKRLNGHGRLLVRSSGTEPVVRVMGEGDDRILVEEVVDNIVSALGQAAA